MHAAAYHLMAELESEHWWYRGRRAAIRTLLRRLDPPEGARVLDVGSGTGGNLDLLAELGGETTLGRAYGLEPSELGGELGRWRGRLIRGGAADLPFRAGSFGVVAALDVLEHLHDELAALDEMRRVLTPGGLVVLHVPAYGMLWGHEDVVSDHLRRYRVGEIRRLLAAAGFTPLHVGYTFATLLPLIAAVKIGKRLLLDPTRVRPDVDALPPAFLNDALTALVEAEAEVSGGVELPFGASVLAAARRA